jgi:hypothetical protein
MVGQSDRRDGVREASTRSDQGSQQVGVTILSFFSFFFFWLRTAHEWVGGLTAIEKERRQNVESRSCPAGTSGHRLDTRDKRWFKWIAGRMCTVAVVWVVGTYTDPLKYLWLSISLDRWKPMSAPGP